MSISPELNELIEKEMAALTPDQFLRPQTSISDFQDDFGAILGRAEEDKDPLISAGFDFNKMIRYAALHEKFSLEHGKRLSSEDVPVGTNKEYIDGMAQAKKDKKILGSASKFIANNSKGSVEVKRAYNSMKTAGTSDTDILNYNIASCNYCRNHSDIVSQVNPAGQKIDEAFLIRVETDAVRLLKLRGVTTVSEDVPEVAVDRQNRLLTLCITAYRDIKQYADQAFLFDPDHYSKYYADGKTTKSDSTDSDVDTPAKIEESKEADAEPVTA